MDDHAAVPIQAMNARNQRKGRDCLLGVSCAALVCRSTRSILDTLAEKTRTKCKCRYRCRGAWFVSSGPEAGIAKEQKVCGVLETTYREMCRGRETSRLDVRLDLEGRNRCPRTRPIRLGQYRQCLSLRARASACRIDVERRVWCIQYGVCSGVRVGRGLGSRRRIEPRRVLEMAMASEIHSTVFVFESTKHNRDVKRRILQNAMFRLQKSRTHWLKFALWQERHGRLACMRLSIRFDS